MIVLTPFTVPETDGVVIVNAINFGNKILKYILLQTIYELFI